MPWPVTATFLPGTEAFCRQRLLESRCQPPAPHGTPARHWLTLPSPTVKPSSPRPPGQLEREAPTLQHEEPWTLLWARMLLVPVHTKGFYHRERRKGDFTHHLKQDTF